MDSPNWPSLLWVNSPLSLAFFQCYLMSISFDIVSYHFTLDQYYYMKTSFCLHTCIIIADLVLLELLTGATLAIVCL